jgi:hypothetical protein
MSCNPGQQDDEALAQLERRHQDNRQQGGVGVHQPGGGRQADRAQDRVQRAVDWVENPEPEQRVGDIGDDRRQIDRRAIEADPAPPPRQQQRQRQCADEPQRHSEQDEEERVADGDQEKRVAEDRAEVVEADPDRWREGVIAREREREREEGRQSDQDSHAQEIGAEE